MATQATSTSARSPSLVRVIFEDEAAAASTTLAEAFATDNVCHYALDAPDKADWTPEQRWKLHADFMKELVSAHIANGLVTTTGEDYACVAFWLPPGCDFDIEPWYMASDVWDDLGEKGQNRLFGEFFRELHDTKWDVMGERDGDSYYLAYIGTREDVRCKGYATRLINDMARKADLEGKAMYLESSNARNVGLYQRLGFDVQKKIVLGKGPNKVGMDIMVREPLMPASPPVI